MNLLTWKNKKIIILIVFLYFIGGGLYIIAESQNKMPEDNYLSSGDSVVRGIMGNINNYSNVINYAYQSDFVLKDLKYSFVENIDFSYDQYLQGICFTDKYVLITSYTDQKDALGRLMIFEKETGEYQITLGLDKKSHLGGVAFDGDNVWVCNSSTMSLERISYDYICEAIMLHKGNMLDVRNLVESYKVGIIPSCITYYKDRLWIATHNKWTNSKMVSYQFLSGKNQLNYVKVYKIPSKVQGIAFDDMGKVYLSTSYGRRSSSYLRTYNSLAEMNKNLNNYVNNIEMPPCSEGIDIDDKKIYVLFESAGKKYLEGTDGKGKSTAPLDKILVIYLA